MCLGSDRFSAGNFLRVKCCFSFIWVNISWLRLSEGQGGKKRSAAACSEGPAESLNAFIVIQLQSMVEFKILWLCDSDLKTNDWAFAKLCSSQAVSASKEPTLSVSAFPGEILLNLWLKEKSNFREKQRVLPEITNGDELTQPCNIMHVFGI